MAWRLWRPRKGGLRYTRLPLPLWKRNWTINPRTKCLSDWIPSATQNNSWETKKCLLTKQTKKWQENRKKKKNCKKRSIPIYCLMNCLSRIKKTYININNEKCAEKCVSNIVLKMIVQVRRSFPEKQCYTVNNVFLRNCFPMECEMPFTFLNLWILEEDVSKSTTFLSAKKSWQCLLYYQVICVLKTWLI